MNWQHYVMWGAGSLGAGAEYWANVDAAHAGVAHSIAAACAAIVMFFGHTSPSVTGQKS